MSAEKSLCDLSGKFYSPAITGEPTAPDDQVVPCHSGSYGSSTGFHGSSSQTGIDHSHQIMINYS